MFKILNWPLFPKLKHNFYGDLEAGPDVVCCVAAVAVHGRRCAGARRRGDQRRQRRLRLAAVRRREHSLLHLTAQAPPPQVSSWILISIWNVSSSESVCARKCY
jgi:hypothetical protein